MKKRVGLSELYMMYTHKKQNGNSKPYVPQSERTDDEYSVTFEEWKRILYKHFDELLDTLFQGLPVELPYKLGVIRLKKYKRSRVSFAKSIKRYGHTHRDKGLWITDKMPMNDGYGLLVDWRKGNHRATDLYKFTIAKKTFLDRCDKVDFFNFSGRT